VVAISYGQEAPWFAGKPRRKINMIKNTTRKGIALGATVALAAAGFVGTPASAAGLYVSGYVNVSPTTGTFYSVLTGNAKEFSLTSNFANAAEDSGEFLKFLVTNAEEDIVVKDGSSSQYSVVATSGSQADAGEIVSLVAPANNFKVGDTVTVTGATAGTINGTFTLTTASGTSLQYVGTAITGGDVASETENITVKLTTPGYTAATDSFVFNTKSDNNNADKTLVLKTGNITTARTATVTAWIDSNDDDDIDAGEYVSDMRTIVWNKLTDVSVVTAMTAPVVGATSLTATITTTPILNGSQTGLAVIDGSFTRQGSTALVESGSATQSATTGVFTVTAGLNQTSNVTPWTGYFPASTIVTVASEDDYLAGAGTTQLITIVTPTAHGLLVADTVTVNADVTGDVAVTDYDVTAGAVVSVPTSTSFTYAVADTNAADMAATAAPATASYTPVVTVSSAIAGVYSVKAKIATVAIGNTATVSTASATSDDLTLSIAATENVQPLSITATTTNNTQVRALTTDVVVTVAVVDSLDVAVTAGRPVSVALNAVSEGGQTGTYKINGTTYESAVTLLTDATGSVSFTLNENDGAAGSKTGLTISSEGQAETKFDLEWAAVDYALYDLNSLDGRLSNRTMEVNGSYTFQFALLDQWNVGADGSKYRLNVTAADRTVSSQNVTLSSVGQASYTVTDGTLGANAWIDVVVAIQVLDGTWGTYNTGTDDWDDGTQNNAADDEVRINVLAAYSDAILLDVDAGTLYDYKGAGVAADLVSPIAAKATVAANYDLTQSSQPAYAEAATINGKVQDSITGVARKGSFVTISGPASVLFSVGNSDSFGSVTALTDENGLFTVNMYSNTSQTDAVITITTPEAGSKTQKVTFGAVATTAGKTITVAAPASALPGSTFNVVITVADAYGNPVSTGTELQMQVTYAGPGIVFGTLPRDTNTLGQISFAVLLGANDSGSALVTVSYDASNDGDFTGTTVADADITVTKTVVVGAAAAASDQKVTVGTYKGYVAVFTKGYEGQKLSVRVASKWHVRNSIVDLKAGYSLLTVNTGAGYVANVIVYIDGVEVERMTITTK
jgi:hypothetical protein